ncbi:13651_t:CDS:2 [Racocetra persica]|uniref:13651_t:CDS:1 n=1 Tax=Racocetra persica TaxID=160502 RepID=A0ACA9KG20_9GLOM|nr:13651_t:CDS:2 [Racocetra persica]
MFTKDEKFCIQKLDPEEPSSTVMKLRKKKKIDYSESPTEKKSSGSEYQEKQEKLKKITYTNNNEIEKVQMSEKDFNKFTKVFQKLEDSKKWVLKSEKIVEDSYTSLE